MRIVGYARVSTREQSENSHALDQQIARLRTAGATEILQDVDSGSKDNRANFKLLLGMIERNETQEVIVTRIDRLTRKLKTLLRVRDVFLNSNCNLRALDDQIDLSSPGGKFHFSLIGSLAEMETDRLAERVQHGWQHMRDTQRVAVAPFGYRIVDGKLELDKEPILCLLENKEELSPCDLARDIIKFFFEVKTLRGTNKRLNEKYGIRRYKSSRGRSSWHKLGFSTQGLSTWIVNPTLIGDTYYPLKRGKTADKTQKEWVVYPDTHESLITLEQNQLIKDILSRNKAVRGYGTRHEQKLAAAGLVVCAVCKATMYSVSGTRGKTPGKNYYWQCKQWRDRSCDQRKTIRVEKVESAIHEALLNKANELAKRADIFDNSMTDNSLEIEKLQSQLASLQQLGFNPAITQAIREIERQIISLKSQSKAGQKITESKYDILLNSFREPSFFLLLSMEQRSRIYRELVERVEIQEGNVVQVVLKV